MQELKPEEQIQVTAATNALALRWIRMARDNLESKFRMRRWGIKWLGKGLGKGEGEQRPYPDSVNDSSFLCLPGRSVRPPVRLICLFISSVLDSFISCLSPSETFREDLDRVLENMPEEDDWYFGGAMRLEVSALNCTLLLHSIYIYTNRLKSYKLIYLKYKIYIFLKSYHVKFYCVLLVTRSIFSAHLYSLYLSLICVDYR